MPTSHRKFHRIDASPHVIYEEETSFKTLKGIFFSTQTMRELMSEWPKILFIDGTYKLTRKGFVFVLINCMDSNNYTHVVGCAILADERSETLSAMFQAFISDNKEASESIESIITDKDLTERNVLKKLLPWVRLFLCQFHILQAMGREITPAKMTATKEEVDSCLEILNCMVKTPYKEVFDKKFEELREIAPPKILLYYLNNHHDLKEEWAKHLMIDFTFGQFTNNRTESLNSSIKLKIPLNNDLCEFIRNIFKWIEWRNTELRHKLAMTMYTTPSCNIYAQDSPEYFYLNLLTDHGFQNLVKPELKRRKLLTMKLNKGLSTFEGLDSGRSVAVTADTCECIFFRMHKLPCRHIFRAREILKLSLNSVDICNERFLKSYFLKTMPLISKDKNKISPKKDEMALNNSSTQAQSNNQSRGTLKKMNSWKTQQKHLKTTNDNFTKLKPLFDDAHRLASEHDTDHRKEFTKQFVAGWRRGHQFALIRIDTNTSSASENDDDGSTSQENQLQNLSHLSLEETTVFDISVQHS